MSSLYKACKDAYLEEEASNYEKCLSLCCDINNVANTLMDAGNIENLEKDVYKTEDLLHNGFVKVIREAGRMSVKDTVIDCSLFLFEQRLLVCQLKNAGRPSRMGRLSFILAKEFLINKLKVLSYLMS